VSIFRAAVVVKPGYLAPSGSGCASFGPDVRWIAAIPRMPAERGAPETSRIVDQEQDELQRVRKVDELKLRGRGERDVRVAAVECAAEATVS
jgi:hypothetical protein